METDDIPVPSAPPAVIAINADTFDYPLAFSCGFVGLGQGGGRIAESFYKLGYRRVVAINTTITDLQRLELPRSAKLDLAVGGAGKDLAAAKAAVSTRHEDIRAFLQSQFGDNPPDWNFLCFGMGGGTGAGIAEDVSQVLRQYCDKHKSGCRTGAIVALPKSDEGPRPKQNAAQVAEWLLQAGLSPVLVLDNQRILELYRPGLSAEYSLGNSIISRLLHTLNKLAASDSDHTAFDRADLTKVLEAGTTALGSQAITNWDSGPAIASAIRNSLQSSLLADVDLSTAKVAGLVFVLGPDAYSQVDASALEQAYAMLTRLLSPGADIFRGIYSGTKNGMTAIYAVGGLQWPHKRLK